MPKVEQIDCVTDRGGNTESANENYTETSSTAKSREELAAESAGNGNVDTLLGQELEAWEIMDEQIALRSLRQELREREAALERKLALISISTMARVAVAYDVGQQQKPGQDAKEELDELSMLYHRRNWSEGMGFDIEIGDAQADLLKENPAEPLLDRIRAARNIPIEEGLFDV